MKRFQRRILKNHMKKPKGLYWWHKKNPVSVYYRAIGKDGSILIEDRNPHEVIGRVFDAEVDHYERIECYEVTPGWKKMETIQENT